MGTQIAAHEEAFRINQAYERAYHGWFNGGMYGQERIDAIDRIWAECTRLGLQRHVAELELFGYTVVEPELIHDPGLPERLRDRILEVAQQRTGIRPDPVDGSTHANIDSAVSQSLQFLLMEGRPFEEAVLEPAALALVSYLVGDGAVISFVNGYLKGPGRVAFPLHTDVNMTPPFPPMPHGASVIWALTDYSESFGSTCFVPGSHRHLRPPNGEEGTALRRPITARAGSLIVFNSYTWHGAVPRAAPGLRVSLQAIYLRSNLQTTDGYRGKLPPHVLDRNPRRFRTLAGEDLHYGSAKDSPGYLARRHHTIASAFSAFGPPDDDQPFHRAEITARGVRTGQ